MIAYDERDIFIKTINVHMFFTAFGKSFQATIWEPFLNDMWELTVLKTFHNFCVLQVLTKEVISANRGDVPQNSLAEHIMQKFVEVFHCLCLLQAIFKLLHFTVLSVIASGVLFSRTFHRRYVFGRFYRWRVFPRILPLSYFLHLLSMTFLLSLSTGAIFSRVLQRLHLALAVCFPALSIGYIFSRARLPLQFRLLPTLL